MISAFLQMGTSFEFIIRNSKNTQDDTINRSANAQMVDSIYATLNVGFLLKISRIVSFLFSPEDSVSIIYIKVIHFSQVRVFHQSLLYASGPKKQGDDWLCVRSFIYLLYFWAGIWGCVDKLCSLTIGFKFSCANAVISTAEACVFNAVLNESLKITAIQY